MARVKCPFCGKSIDASADWCRGCSSKIFRQKTGPNETTVFSQICLKTGAAVFVMAVMAFAVIRLAHLR
jgi:hypothetical protein